MRYFFQVRRMDVFSVQKPDSSWHTSGLYLLATAFGTPCAVANVIPSSILRSPHRRVYFEINLVNSRESVSGVQRNLNQAVAEYRFADLFT